FDNLKVFAGSAATDFAISATPSSQTVVQGASTSYTATVTPSGGFTGTVSFSLTGLPAGAGGTFAPASVMNGSGSSTLTVTTSATTPAGSSTLTIKGTSGNLSHSANVMLTVTAASSPTTITFDDISPANRTLSGQYPTGVINWGSGTSWYLSGPWGLFTTQSLSFGSSQTSASFTF